MALDIRLHRRGFCCGPLGVAVVGGVIGGYLTAETDSLYAVGPPSV